MKNWYVVLLVILVLSPIDIIPDTIPIAGWIDDALYILAAYKAMTQPADKDEDAEPSTTIEARKLG